MASITRFFGVRRLRAESNQFILHYTGGRVTRQGPGISYWFLPLAAAIAQVPVEDIETTFLLHERSADFQELAVQCTVIYRFADYAQAAARVNFSVALSSGVWLDPPLERLANFWAQRARTPARDYLVTVPVVEAVKSGPAAIRAALEQALHADPDVKAMGMELVSLQVVRVAPEAEVDKALQTPTREAIQQKADEAVFSRRALAVEKERAIKENELATEIELAKQQEQLIQRQGANQLLEAQLAAETERQRVEANLLLQERSVESEAKRTLTRAESEAQAQRIVAAAQLEQEQQRVGIYSAAPGRVALGLALQKLAGSIQSIQHLNVSPDLLGSTLEQFLRDQDSGPQAG